MARHKCILLYSGGLDSLIAAKLLMDQDIDVVGFHCILPFVSPDFAPGELISSKSAGQIELPLVHHRCGREYLEMVKNPPHGYGKNMNPCIDCKMYFIDRAAQYMEETGADFLATGEVVGQRPMSQLKHTMNHIFNTSNLEGRLLRPLSAKILKPTIMEETGIIDREKLLDISGRGRKRQMELARHYGIKNYSSPAGGCLFTDVNVSRRVSDLFVHHDDFSPLDMYLLTIGRHFRLDEHSKIIIAKNEIENLELEKYRDSAHAFLEPSFKGPSAFLRGNPVSDVTEIAVSIIARYGRPDPDENTVIITEKNGTQKKILVPEPISDDVLDKMRI